MYHSFLKLYVYHVALNLQFGYGFFCRVLTWEDAYYDNCEQHDPPENKCVNKKLEKLHDGLYSHDPLGLAVAKMSYHVYSLGEG